MRRRAAFALVLLAALAIMGSRAVSKIQVGDGYFNEVKRTGIGKVRFHKTVTGPAVSPATTQRVYFMDVLNTSTATVTMQIYTSTGWGSPASFIAYMGKNSSRSFDGIPIDSVNVLVGANVSTGTPLYFTGRDRR